MLLNKTKIRKNADKHIRGIAFSVRRGKDSERMFQGHTVRERSRVGHCLHSEARFFPRFSREEKQVWDILKYVRHILKYKAHIFYLLKGVYKILKNSFLISASEYVCFRGFRHTLRNAVLHMPAVWRKACRYIAAGIRNEGTSFRESPLYRRKSIGF